ncbi:MAG: DNA-deoxyinosine glycosylase [Bacteroidales bacterium]|nr:DNA-deoxyinosine glycosylase [Bacteroidales bacterium]
MPFGLSIETITGITATIAANRSVTRVILFGSRAKGNPRPGSDIDIAVTGSGLSLDDYLSFSLQIDRLELAQKVDLVDHLKINDDELIDHIRRVGVVLYENGRFRKYGLPPVIDYNSRILILGTFPSEISLEKQQFYANPANKFWMILCSVINESYTLNYDQRIQLLKKHRIALWDVVESCLREGSGDNEIRFERPNDLETLINQFPSLTHLLFNGTNPVRFFTKLGLDEGPMVLVPSLPSSSGLNTHLTLSEKIDRWAVIHYIPGFH